MKPLALPLLVTTMTITLGNAHANTTNDPSAFDAVSQLVGTYRGEWTLYGIDATGQIVAKSSWTDVMEAKDPVLEDGKAFVHTRDVMSFANGQSFTLESTEGYLVNRDGTAGERYYLLQGTPVIERQLSAGCWAFEVASSQQELASIGFSNVIQANHVMVKTVRADGKVEIDSVTRVTTVTWKDGDGNVQTRQFVSLQGVHRRELGTKR
jgi:hypothetical protein